MQNGRIGDAMLVGPSARLVVSSTTALAGCLNGGTRIVAFQDNP